MPFVSPLRTTDAGIDGQDNNGNVGKITSLQHPDQRGNVRQSRGPDPGSDKEFCSIALEVVDKLSPGLFSPGKIFAAWGAGYLHLNRTIRNLLCSLAYEIDGSKELFCPYCAASITVPTAVSYQIEVELPICAIAGLPKVDCYPASPGSWSGCPEMVSILF